MAHSWTVTWPLIIGSLSATALALVDTALLGRYGTDALASIAVALPLFVLGSALVIPWGTAIQVLVARWSGAGDRAAIARLLDLGLLICLAAGTLPALVIAATAPVLVDLVAGGAAPADSTTALRILAACLPFTAVTAHYRGVFGGLTQTSVTMRVALIVNLANIPLDVLFVFGLDQGVVGSAIGTVLATMLGAAYVAWLARRRLAADYPYPRRAHLRSPGPMAGQVWQIGWPDVTFAVLVYGADALLAAVVATIGTTELAGYRLMVTTVSLLWVVVFACSSGIAILAGQRLGAGDLAGVRGVARAGALLMTLLGLLVVAAPLVVPGLYFPLFSDDPAVVAHAEGAAWVLLALVPAMVVSMTLAGVLRAGGDTKGILYAGALSQLLLAVPVAWFAATRLEWGLSGVYAGFATGVAARAVCTVVRFRQGRWRTALAPARA